MKTRFCIDGNDGTGKTSLVRALRSLGFDADDRGLPCKLTDLHPFPPYIEDGALHVILDVDPSVSMDRLQKRGADMRDAFHNLESLEYYRPRYVNACQHVNGLLVDASGSEQTVLRRVLETVAQNERGPLGQLAILALSLLLTPSSMRMAIRQWMRTPRPEFSRQVVRRMLNNATDHPDLVRMSISV